ncbi:M20/M25/M40 family metallo-hydrolase (plasmid) [Phyllobacterium sp. 628]|uniref:M20/M25/M40 family metallo-hydrolase n=1 Tax=Phyllobacterium sp. 628 TaxID=2718938 RepID=UPI0016628301|nr:M20/M25/M40 family metallo-hydrolase [Phyllobacterium sp. 628]QND54509.1 M20/M25/M40 family metallo-hydrolase [Phyllobacterium sp. 628]
MTPQLQTALGLAAAGRSDSIAGLAALIRMESPTGEEGDAQRYIAGILETFGAEVTLGEPDIEAMFARYPDIAQYPTHWQHDLILPYDSLPSHEDLLKSGLNDVLNYDGRPNVVGVFRGTGGGRSLILNAHIDTVTIEPTGKWTRAPYGAEIEDGIMYGRGTSDMKGGMMAAIMAIIYLQQAGVALKGDVIFHSVVNEEHSGNGTLDLVRRGCQADAAIVLEPTNNQILISQPGGLYWQLRISGIARSPGARWNGPNLEGISAIELLPVAIEALAKVERSYNDQSGSPDSKPFSLVMGKINGGHYETVTADEVILKGGAYFAPQIGSVIDVMQRLRSSIDEINRSNPLLRKHPLKLEFLHHDDSVMQDVDIDIAKHLGHILGQRGKNPVPLAGPFCCDARHLVNRGKIPTVIFGPGTIAQAHKPDECIQISDYLDSIETLIELIGTWCGEAPAVAAKSTTAETVS